MAGKRWRGARGGGVRGRGGRHRAARAIGVSVHRAHTEGGTRGDERNDDLANVVAAARAIVEALQRLRVSSSSSLSSRGVVVRSRARARCKELGVDVLAYSPLALGLLTGRYGAGALPEGPRASIAKRLFEPGTEQGVAAEALLSEVRAWHALVRRSGGVVVPSTATKPSRHARRSSVRAHFASRDSETERRSPFPRRPLSAVRGQPPATRAASPPLAWRGLGQMRDVGAAHGGAPLSQVPPRRARGVRSLSHVPRRRMGPRHGRGRYLS